MKRWAGYGVILMIGLNVVAAVATITRALREPDWWGAITLVAVLAGVGGYAAGRVRPKQLASVVVRRRVREWRKGDPLWLVTVPYVVVHPVVFARSYVCEVRATRRRRKPAA